VTFPLSKDNQAAAKTVPDHMALDQFTKLMHTFAS